MAAFLLALGRMNHQSGHVFPCHLKTGMDAECAAADYCQTQLSARLICKNYRIRGGEIDLVCEVPVVNQGECEWELVFVEVRARLNPSWQSGLESVNPKKKRRLKRAIQHFLMTYRGPASRLRVDVLDWNGKQWSHAIHIQLED